MKLQSLSHTLDAYIFRLLDEFDDKFMIGLTTGVMALSIMLYRSFGLGFSLATSGQMHVISIDAIFLLIPLCYFLLSHEGNNGKRVFASICFAVFVFSIHDVAWLIETHWVKPVFLYPIADLDLRQYIYHYSKNSMNLLISSVGIIRFFRLSKKFLLAFSIQITFHLVNILYHFDGYVLNPYMLIMMYLFDTIPYFFLLRRTSR